MVKLNTNHIDVLFFNFFFLFVFVFHSILSLYYGKWFINDCIYVILFEFFSILLLFLNEFGVIFQK
jgi:hypothetical protein